MKIEEAQAILDALRALRSAKLDEFRAEARMTKTSDLLAMFADSEQMLARFDDGDVMDFSKATSDRSEREVMAAGLAIADEIDRRIPVPT